MASLPDFDSLPPVEGMPQGCAWGIFDKNGQKDILGTLNLLTPEIVREAASEIQTGESVSLNWPLDAIAKPGFGRKALEQTVYDAYPTWKAHSFDDEIAFNTQCSSQWDSLCHHGHQKTGIFYNGVKPTIPDIKKGGLPTLEAWHTRGGLAGRGVLLDYKAWADANEVKYSPFDGRGISLGDLKAVAAHQGTTFKYGDILIVRCGYTEAMEAEDADGQAAKLATFQAGGVEGNEDMARWIWNQHFAAVAGDAIAFEAMPGGAINLVLHEYLITMFGMCMGELWDLKALSAKCAQHKRWTFFLTSAPLNYKGSIASPPNVLAIF